MVEQGAFGFAGCAGRVHKDGVVGLDRHVCGRRGGSGGDQVGELRQGQHDGGAPRLLHAGRHECHQLGSVQQQRGAGVGEQVRELGWRAARVGRHEDPARAQHGVRRHDERCGVARHEQDTVAGREAPGHQFGGGALDLMMQLAVRRAPFPEYQGLSVGAAGGREAQRVRDRRHRRRLLSWALPAYVNRD